MVTSLILQIALLVLALVFGSLTLFMAARRLYDSAKEKKVKRKISKVKPFVLEVVTSDDADTACLDEVPEKNRDVLFDVVWDMLAKVKGLPKSSLVQWLDNSGAIDIERKRLRSFRDSQRMKAVFRLGDAGLLQDASKVELSLNSKNPHLRVIAARSLGKIGDPNSVDRLLRAASGERVVPVGPLVMALIHIGPRACETLREWLTNSNHKIRLVSATLLGLHGDIESAPYLAEIAVLDKSADVRAAAIEAMGRIGHPKYARTLIRISMLGNSGSDRIAATTALGNMGGDQAYEALIRLILQDDRVVSRAAFFALSRFGEKGEAALREIAESKEHLFAGALEVLSLVDIRNNRREARRVAASARRSNRAIASNQQSPDVS